ncbi:MAG: hypothetical protein AAB091_04780 [Elusimicrobiota bacterium]
MRELIICVSALMFVFGPLRVWGAGLPSLPDDVTSVHEHNSEHEYKHHYRGRSDRHSEWNLEEAGTLGFSLGHFSQPALTAGQAGSPALAYPVYWIGATSGYRFAHNFTMQGWPLQMVLPEVSYRYYFTHGVAGGISLGYGSQAVNTLSFDVAETHNGADRAFSRGRLEAQDKATQIPLFFFLQMDTKPSMALKPYFRVGLGLVSASVTRTMIFTTTTDIDTASDGTINAQVIETDTLFSGTANAIEMAGRTAFGLEWAAHNNRIIRMDIGYQGALASVGSLAGSRLDSTNFSRDLGPRNFSGLVMSVGVDFLW